MTDLHIEDIDCERSHIGVDSSGDSLLERRNRPVQISIVGKRQVKSEDDIARGVQYARREPLKFRRKKASRETLATRSRLTRWTTGSKRKTL